MTDNWDRTFFDKELKSILDSKLPVSASKITSLQQLATSHPKHHNYIVQCITKFIESAPPDYRLAGLYVIDAISRAVHKQLRRREENNEKGSFEAEGYLKRFAIVLKDDSLIGCFESCSTKDKDKVKKTLDFWEQGSIYPKEVVQYVKDSFLKQMSPPVDTAALLATLSNIGNLNIPGLTSNNNNSSSISNSSTSSDSSNGSYTTPIANTSTTTTVTTTAAPVTQQVNKDLSLPPALAKLLGSLVTTPTPASTSAQVQAPVTNTPAQVRLDPRLAASESKIKPSVWPPPQGPSVPLANVGRTEKKSRWGNDTDNIANKTTTTTTTSPVTVTPHTTHTTSTITANSSAQEPWLHRQMTQTANNNNNNNINNAPIYQQMNQQLYQQQYQQYYQQQYQYYQQQQQQQQQPLQQIQYKGAQPMSDTSLPPGCIRVLTRTLFVGPIPDHYEREDVARLFAKYGEIASVIVSKKLKGRHNAFLKFTTRAATEAAKYDGAGLMVEGMPVKVNWGFGFGPKKHFNYDRGDSIIPLAELSAEEKDNLVIARVGGFQGQPVRDRMVIEEPEAEYKPEWKDDERGVKRYNNQFEDNRKRTRH
ncbi:hypothetical protein BCV72DRAFT_310151 [Rhizopus microsporus var. microsporus]|uniref:CID domain-containing protein n=1 Tax=Rhizopus microsporus var. microsporus TaxID=86635 RepID=A0A1X0QNJ7_RHIZD|nr:hypothetical protein BCV72DRAFT_310151 [Rhizopus microsporus var. microsporus]